MKKYTLYQMPLLIGNGRDKRINKTKNNNRIVNNNEGNTVEELKHKIGEEKFMADFKKYCPDIPYTPAILPKKKRIIVLGDIHGDYKLAIEMLKLGKLINDDNENDIKWIGGDTVVVQVGDQVDRCRPNGNLLCDNPATTPNDEASDIKILELFTDLDKQSRKVGGMVISLIGNHELMNTMGQLSYVSYEGIKFFENYKDKSRPEKTFESPKKAREYAFAPGNEFGVFLACTRVPSVIIGSNLFVHGGIIDSIVEYLKINEKSDIETINVAIKKWLLGLLDKNSVDKLVSSGSKSIFWSRILGSIPPNTDISDDICMSHISNVLKIFKIDNLIVGHTPQTFMYKKGINGTCSEKVWRVDNASSSAFHLFDDEYIRTGKASKSRQPQVLEILDDSTFNVIH
ncbi:metallophosphatase/phosphoesterase [Catovirus CTV1]|uniref:Metallophosphatase/phosphoesterase n=1 Tax=Catovirus CTV1 TaxID=1977631 RepID=A0A1V0SC58_9VIRU|nr:metallophosphatase/phosphoesterase [Catovirus CTV1]